MAFVLNIKKNKEDGSMTGWEYRLSDTLSIFGQIFLEMMWQERIERLAKNFSSDIFFSSWIFYCFLFLALSLSCINWSSHESVKPGLKQKLLLAFSYGILCVCTFIIREHKRRETYCIPEEEIQEHIQ